MLCRLGEGPANIPVTHHSALKLKVNLWLVQVFCEACSLVDKLKHNLLIRGVKKI